MTPSVLEDVKAARPCLWVNPSYQPDSDPAALADLTTAQSDWARLSPLLKTLFPELVETQGQITSELLQVDALKSALGYDAAEYGRVFIKADHALPVAGSIKARGGLFEVLMTAYRQAVEAGMLQDTGDVRFLASPEAKQFFATRTIAVGSTGNLGLSVGIAARALGYRAIVHMSCDAKAWKIARLEALGVEVVLHDSDYNSAVAAAREAARKDPLAYFVDDEDSELLFRGYSAAAVELRDQLATFGVQIDATTPLFLYLPCGIGGAPGGVAYGASGLFGANVHPFFVEPVQAPSALCQMMSGLSENVSVYDFGLNNKTEADGMAVATMSHLVAEKMQHRLAGVFTAEDDNLFRWLALAKQTEGLKLEPSATAGFCGPAFLTNSAHGAAFQARHLSDVDISRAVHVIWTTGGSFVPDDQFDLFYDQGLVLLNTPHNV
ncbi:MAG: D-serine ammonia-lyase [Rhodobacteraceae bacterium]|nr:D-serine ammonia-lyase [Paracoccaceae bacterium]